MTTKRREWWIDNDDNEIFSIKPIEIGRDCEYYHVTEIHAGECVVSGELLDRVIELLSEYDRWEHSHNDNTSRTKYVSEINPVIQKLRDVRAK